MGEWEKKRWLQNVPFHYCRYKWWWMWQWLFRLATKKYSDWCSHSKRKKKRSFTLLAGLWRHQWTIAKCHICHPVAGEARRINKHGRSLILRLECPSHGYGPWKDVWMIHRVQCGVSSGLRNSVGGLYQGSSPTSLFICDLTEGMTTNKLLYFHFYAFVLARNESIACSNKPTLFFAVNSSFNNISTVEPPCPRATLCKTPTDISPLPPKG